MSYNYEKMWKELKEKLKECADADGLLIMADVDDIMEELENEWLILIRR